MFLCFFPFPHVKLHSPQGEIYHLKNSVLCDDHAKKDRQPCGYSPTRHCLCLCSHSNPLSSYVPRLHPTENCGYKAFIFLSSRNTLGSCLWQSRSACYKIQRLLGHSDVLSVYRVFMEAYSFLLSLSLKSFNAILKKFLLPSV